MKKTKVFATEGEESNKREKRYAGYILDGLNESAEAARDAEPPAVPTRRGLINDIVENLNEYRAELCLESTAGGREAAMETAYQEWCDAPKVLNDEGLEICYVEDITNIFRKLAAALDVA